MKQKLFLPLLTSLSLLALVACASFQATSGKLLVTTAATVDAAMKGWATYVVANNVPESGQTQVRIAYANYQLAMKAAQQAYGAAVSSGDQSGWQTASAALTASSTALTQLVASLEGVKP